MTTTLRRVRVLTGYSAHARFLAECAPDVVGRIPRDRSIPSPYVFSPDHAVFAWEPSDGRRGIRVIIAETRHRRYEVFEIPSGTALMPPYEDDEDPREDGRPESDVTACREQADRARTPEPPCALCDPAAAPASIHICAPCADAIAREVAP